MIIGYDEKRGEPRHKGKPTPGAGDCIDCSACVVACPTGIDIREGLQLECIACGQCVDACNTIMPKVNQPPGLIRYASQRSLVGGISRVVRTRLVAYTVLLLILLTALIVVGAKSRGVDVTLLRGIGAPYVIDEAGVRNQVRIKLENRSSLDDAYRIEILFEEETEPGGVSVVIPENPMRVEGKGRRSTSVFLVTPISAFREGRLPITVRITGQDGESFDKPYHLIGPDGETP